MNSNQRKDATLGMSHGTACGRLRKKILFHLLKKLGENHCFKCTEFIDKVEDLSIEHKQPWEGRSAELFWDIENIAFSHLHCNRPHCSAPGRAGLYKENPLYQRHEARPEGTAWCGGHKAYIEVNKFHSNIRNQDGTASYCKECRKIRLD